jgi:hypothetical protein
MLAAADAPLRGGRPTDPSHFTPEDRMTAHPAESPSVAKGLPLFMRGHTVVDNRRTLPREGVDFVYDSAAQKATWLTDDTTNKWSPTEFGDTKVDGVDFVAINLEPTD